MDRTKHERTWLDENGHALPLEECTKEQIIARFHKVVDDHRDRLASERGAKDALLKRLKDTRKAKSLANRRADIAVAAMKSMLETFEKSNG